MGNQTSGNSVVVAALIRNRTHWLELNPGLEHLPVTMSGVTLDALITELRAARKVVKAADQLVQNLAADEISGDEAEQWGVFALEAELAALSVITEAAQS